MKMVKIFGEVLLMSGLVYAGGDFQLITDYESNNEALLVEKAYVNSYIDEPVEVYVEQQPYAAVVYEENEDEGYTEPIVEGYVDPVIIEEPMAVTSSSNLGNAVNVYNASKRVKGEKGFSKNSTTHTNIDRASSSIAVGLGSKNGFYAGLGISALNYNIHCDCPDRSAKDTAVGGMTKIGYNINKFIAVEARGIKVNLKNNRGSVKHAGLFLKPMLPLSPVANAYTLVGVAQTKTSGRVRKVDTKNFALGAGMEFGAGKGVGAFVDYERMVVKSGAPDLDVVSTGLSFGF